MPCSVGDTGNKMVRGTLGTQTSAAIRRVQSDAGLDATGIGSSMLFKEILNTDGFLLNRIQGDSTVRIIQQALNKKYNSYFGIKPCVHTLNG